MTEADAIDRVDEPVTIDRLVEEFADLGIAVGDTIICHASLSSIGWVSGDAPAVVDALRTVVSEDGTLIMPTHTPQYTDPEAWSSPPVPASWVDTIKSTRPPYRPAVTPTRGIGAIAECFRTYPDVHRSNHPTYSFAVWGASAETIVEEHGFDHPLGEGSPLSAVYERDGTVLMLGTEYGTNTSLHLAEYRADIELDQFESTAPIAHDGSRRDITFEEIETSTDDFEEVGSAFEEAHDPTIGTVGAATTRLIDQRSLVDFAAEWFSENR